MKSIGTHSVVTSLCAAVAGILAISSCIAAPTARHERVIRSLNAKSGYEPLFENLVLDGDGNLYGTARSGGANDYGTVFRVAPDGSLKVLYSFPGGDGGLYPSGPVAFDEAGNIYGTTYTTVFKLSPNGLGGYTASVLHVFTGKPDGASAQSGLIIDKAGNLYGTTFRGGANDDGTVFEISSSGEETILHSFSGNDGGNPSAGVFRDKAGILYGTATYGGAQNCIQGCGTVYEIAADGTFTLLHLFFGPDGGDGAWPIGGVIRDPEGNLFGTTSWGGTGGGTVFEVFSTGTTRLVYSLGAADDDGLSPECTLVRDGHGNLYGTTNFGGASNHGTVFRIAPDGSEKTLYAFKGAPKGGNAPVGGLTLGPSGILFGTTSKGGRSDSGTIFMMNK